MIKTLAEWLIQLEQRHPRLIDLGLERIGVVAKRLNVTAFHCPVITIAGTNGKGSTVALLEQIYLSAGYRVGSYTSPHLLRFNERIRLNGEEVSDAALCAAFSQVGAARQDISLSYFEFTTLTALLLFQQANLEIIVLEVGLGGRLDAVNIVEPTLSVITSISIDHTDWLGNDRNSIGCEKAGIFRSHKPVVCGDADPPPSLTAHAQQLAAPFYQINRDFHYQAQTDSWSWQGLAHCYACLPIPTVQLSNAATALMAVETLQSSLLVKQGAIVTGLERVKLLGRLQIVHQPRLLVLDVSHNPGATQLLADYLQQRPIEGRTLAVVGMLADKEIADSLRPLIPLIHDWYVGSLTVARGAGSELIIQKLQALNVARCYNFASAETAYQQALAASSPTDRIVIFGSFHTVAAVLALLNKKSI